MARAPWIVATKQAIFFLVLLPVVWFSGATAHAAENIEIPSDGVKVYSKSDIGSQVIGVLNHGTVVPAATNPVGNFKKVMIVVGGQKKIGYVNLYDIKGDLKVVTSLPTAAGPTPAAPQAAQAGVMPPGPGAPPPPPAPIQTPEQLRAQNPPPQVAARPRYRRVVNYGLHHRAALGLMLGVNYQSQGPTQYSDGSGGVSNAGTLTGADPMFGLSYAIPMNFKMSIEPYFLYKQISVTGTLSPAFGGPSAPAAFVLQQTYVSLGALARWYSSLSSYFWYGGGLQIDHAMSGTFQIGSNNPVQAQQGDLPNLIMLYGVLGVDFKLSKSLYLVPDLRLGALVNTSPAIFEVDGYLTLKFAL